MAQMAQTKTATPGLESIDRLEEKIKLLVNTIGRIKGEQNRVAEENGRLKAEIEALKGRINSAESAGAEVTSLREERDLIKARVTDMLKQLDGLNL
jgi:regulator of replication initiation timing